MKRVPLITVIIMAFLILLSSIAVASHGHKQKNAVIPAINIETTQVSEMAIPTTLFSVGSLIALKSANLSSEVDGRIVKILFENGDSVTQGQPIIQLDDIGAKADLFSAEAALHLSQATYNRYLVLIKQGAVSQETLDQQQSDLESKEADVQSKKVALAQKTITAAFSGVLAVFQVTPGEYITSGEALVKLVDKHQLKVQYTIPQKYLAWLELGQVISVNSDSYPNTTFYGEVSFIAPSIDQDTGSVTVQATIDNSKNLLSPGMFVTINQIIQEDPNALVVPEQAVLASLQGSYVFVVKNNTAHLVKVTIGDRRDFFVQVHGLSLSDIVVTAGQQKLHDGSAVNILPPPPKISYVPKIHFDSNSWLNPAPQINEVSA